MTNLDYIVLLGYLAGIFAVGMIFASRNRDSSEMFAAGGQSPWWTSGLSGFMTMFSAGTFVVWGGIAYRLGIVALMINLMYGLAALLVGYFVAGRWKQLGVGTPAEYVRLRFGEGAVHFVTWGMMVFRIVGVAVALYAMAIMLVALMPLAEGNPFRNPETGNLAVHWALLLFGGIVVVYTMIGGLWAVLMTDVLQFIVLNLAILFVIPLALMQVGGFSGFVAEAPENFFNLTAPLEGYTFFFLAGWLAIHFFMIGAEWAFVQRFICVSSPREARKSSYLFGVLYLVSPIFWLLPPLLWRVASPIPEAATSEEIIRLSEQAYIEACRSVLPVGMIGLLVAAMFSATASMASSQLNVFAGVLTRDVYGYFRKHTPSAAHFVWVGRLFTLLLGVVLIGLALAVPRLGGAERVVVTITQLLIVPLLAPLLWGLFSKRLDAVAIWATVGICGTAGILVKFGFDPDGWFADVGALQGVIGAIAWLDEVVNIDAILGVALPVAIVALVQRLRPGRSLGWQRVSEFAEREAQAAAQLQPVRPSRLPGLIVGWALILFGLLLASLMWFVDEDRFVVLIFTVALCVIGIAILIASRHQHLCYLRESSGQQHEGHRE